jgi:radical SAM superfamily enzyme YgiQ (UPF0313 family)
MGLTLPYLAALTPKEVDIKVVDERLEDVDVNAPVDLVAMTVFTRSSRRAYDLARMYRDKKVPVVMGGFHPTLDPKDAAPHADSLILGEGEDVWAEALKDAAAGRLKPVYQRTEFHSLQALPTPRFDMMPLHKYKIPFMPVQTSRGCPFACTFCEVSLVYGQRYRLRPVDEVIAEIKEAKLTRVHFADDNFAAKKERTMELMEKLIPLKLDWTCLLTLKDAADEDLLDLAKRSGCGHINIGLESIQPSSLKQMRKLQNRVSDYEESLALLNKKAMSYSVNFVFGWDTDTLATFKHTLEFLNQNRVPMAFFSLLAPRIGTKIHEQLKAEGRLIGEIEYEGRNPKCIFLPKGMSPRELEDNLWWIQRKLYSLPSMLRRGVFGFRRVGWRNILLSNIFFGVSARFRISPLDFY